MSLCHAQVIELNKSALAQLPKAHLEIVEGATHLVRGIGVVFALEARS